MRYLDQPIIPHLYYWIRSSVWETRQKSWTVLTDQSVCTTVAIVRISV